MGGVNGSNVFQSDVFASWGLGADEDVKVVMEGPIEFGRGRSDGAARLLRGNAPLTASHVVSAPLHCPNGNVVQLQAEWDLTGLATITFKFEESDDNVSWKSIAEVAAGVVAPMARTITAAWTGTPMVFDVPVRRAYFRFWVKGNAAAGAIEVYARASYAPGAAA